MTSYFTVVLAYSGGLDTSSILKWLLEKKYNVICYTADIGQNEDFEAATQKAFQIGASDVIIEDLKEHFMNEYIMPAVQMGLIYEQRNLLGISLSRPCISEGLVRCFKKYNAEYIAHGATGKGNDQIRFELSCYAICPTVQILAPWRMEEFTSRFQGRLDLIKYAALHNIPTSVTLKKPWSIDANFMDMSYESGTLENPATAPPKELYKMSVSPQQAPDIPFQISITFENGVPISGKTSKGEEIYSSMNLFIYLNKIGGKYGIGRFDLVENRFTGIKCRGLYETPAVHILYVAHQDLEIFCLDREVLRLKQYLSERMGEIVYNGFWFSPEGEFVKSCLINSQKGVTGTVHLELYKGNVIILGREAAVSLYNQDLVSMNRHAEFTPSDATGFINIQAIRLKEFHRCKRQLGII